MLSIMGRCKNRKIIAHGQINMGILESDTNVRVKSLFERADGYQAEFCLIFISFAEENQFA